jgi:hypothetical protein
VTQTFGVDPARLELIGRNLEVAGDYLDQAEAAVRSCPPAGTDVFAEYGVVAAYREFFDLWAREVHTTAGATHQLSHSLRQAVDGYRHSDDGAARRFGPR